VLICRQRWPSLGIGAQLEDAYVGTQSLGTRNPTMTHANTFQAEITLADGDGKPICDEYQKYTYGVCFDNPKFENKYREYVVEHFGEYLTLSKTTSYFNWLILFNKNKVFPLVVDAWDYAQKHSSLGQPPVPPVHYCPNRRLAKDHHPSSSKGYPSTSPTPSASKTQPHFRCPCRGTRRRR
jgi:hypothetical protein